jgi:hypothetical protein
MLARHAEIPGLRSHLADAFGRHDELVALAAQPVADDLLGSPRGIVAAAQGVDVGGIEEIDPASRRGVHDRMALGHVALQAERHRPEAQP